MQQDMLTLDHGPFPETVVESIRKLYPFPRKKSAEQARIREALHRIAVGEIDGSPRSAAEAIEYLRQRTAEARALMYGRDKKFVPHATTFFNQSRYLTPVHAEIPANLEDAISVLQCYPGMPGGDWSSKDVAAHLPALKLIDEHIRYLHATHGIAAASYVRTRVLRFSECVSRWPVNEMQFIPNVVKFVGERRYEQDERRWNRSPTTGFTSEREQFQRLA